MNLHSRFRNYLDLYHYHGRRSELFADHDYQEVYLAARERVERVLGHPIRGMHILDVGCGQRFPLTLLFTHAGNRTIGIDAETITTRPGLLSLIRMCRSSGPERALKTLVRQVLFDPRYYHRLEEQFGSALPRRHLDIRRLSVIQPLPFPTDTMDLIISNAVFEHLPDVPAALRELTRILKPGGILHIAVHLFPSLSGGHHMRWAFPDSDPPDDIPPWDHLRQNLFPAHVYLNRLRKDDYLGIFHSEEAIEVLFSMITRTEGEGFLTPLIESELSTGYARQELLEREILFVARKRSRLT